MVPGGGTNTTSAIQNYVSLVSASETFKNTKFFGFVGINKAKCSDIKRPGAFYIALARKTGGRTYDICESDWSKYYQDLTQTIKTQVVGNQIPTNFGASTIIVSIYHNGQRLNRNEYSFNSQGVMSILKSNIQVGDKITVNYNEK